MYKVYGPIKHNAGRVRYIRTMLNLTLNEFAEKLGLSAAQLSRIENDKSAITPSVLIRMLREWPEINIEYLRAGDSPPLLNQQTGTTVAEGPLPHYTTAVAAAINKKNCPGAVPIVHTSAAGGAITVPELNNSMLLLPGMQNAHAATYVFARSMEPTLQPGDIILLRKLADLTRIEFGATFLIVTESANYLRVVKATPAGTAFLLQAENQAFDTIQLPASAVQQLWQVVGAYRKTC